MNRLFFLIWVIISLGCGSVPGRGREEPEGDVLDITTSTTAARVGELVSVEVVFDTYKKIIRDPFTGELTDEFEADDNGLSILLPLGLEYVSKSAELDSGLEPSTFNKREPDYIVTCDEGTPPGTLPVNSGRQAIRFDFPGGASLTSNIARLRFQVLVAEPTGVVEIEASLRNSTSVRVCFYRGDGEIDRRRSLELLP
jgi:hypothetical protein